MKKYALITCNEPFFLRLKQGIRYTLTGKIRFDEVLFLEALVKEFIRLDKQWAKTAHKQSTKTVRSKKEQGTLK